MKSGWRLGAIGVAFAVMFAVLTLQLWQVQVVATETYVQEAENSQIKFVNTPAPRGQIVDRAGRQLAGTTTALSAVLVVAGSFLADLLYYWADPRLRAPGETRP